MPAACAYSLFIVPSASHAMKGEKALTRASIANKLIPVPRTLSSQCGVCLRVATEDRARAEHVLAEAGVQVSAIHDIEQQPRTKEREGERTDVSGSTCGTGEA